MPIYEYHCDECGHTFEVMESITGGNAEQTCPKCKSAAKRMISASAFHFKGSGWYVSDYKNKKPGKEIPPCAAKSDAPACSGCAHAQTNK